MRGIATFLTTAVLGVVHFFYKPPAAPVVQPGNEPIPATSTLPSMGEGVVPAIGGTPAVLSSSTPLPLPSYGSSGEPTPSKISTGKSIGVSDSSNFAISSMPFNQASTGKQIITPTSTTPINLNVIPPLSTIKDYVDKNIITSVSTGTIATPPPPSMLPLLPTLPPPIIASSSFVNPPPPPISVSSGLTQTNPIVSVTSSSTIITQQIAALSGLPLSTPQKQEPLNSTGPEMYKVFDFAVSANSFAPNAVIVQQGDLAQLNITSSINTTLESKDLQFSVPITIGGTSAVSIPATNIGTFVFYATGSNSQPIFGYFVVRSRT